jgi:two-component system KDP operon response regulator KdpE
MSNNTILIVDDESQIRRLLEITLSASKYKVVEASNGRDAIQMAASHQPLLIILDLGLPDMDGMEVLRKLREWYQKPVIILSARKSEEDIVQALDKGANDYLSKPFRTGELLARIRACLRSMQATDETPLFQVGDLSVDLVDRVARKGDRVLNLTPTEFTLLGLFIKNQGRVLTHQYILQEIWGYNRTDDPQSLRVFVAQLRKKIENDPSKPTLLITESGIGYRFGS